ncbi:MAG: rhomboid family intramembrane serine protease [Candidatus Rokubacteria bacterium]|nr:rhomboid family intramembrane serine protease [Candidatus Rokubacteria bacterium]
MHPLRVAPTRAHAEEWALVLTAAAIPNAVEPDDDGWAVLAPADDVPRALAMLAAYDDERRDAVATRADDRPYPWMSGVALGLLLVWIHTLTDTPAWREPGAAIAGRILDGEWWRTVTALTLHADVVHVVGNACALAVLVPPLVQRFGAGAALIALVASGVLGNTLAALTHDARHSSVGASTAAFAAVGILVADRLVTREPTRRKRWLVPIAGVLLVAMLGMGPRADLAAHAFGFVAGGVLGAPAALLTTRPFPPTTQWLLGVLAALIVAASWHLALKG